MKKHINIILGIAFCISMAACSLFESSPSDVATTFLNNLSKGDFVSAKTLVTKDAEQSIDALAQIAADQVRGKKYKVTKEVIDGSMATVFYKQEGIDKEKSLKLTKVDGKWKIMFDKMEFTGSMDQFNESIKNMGDSIENAFGIDTLKPKITP